LRRALLAAALLGAAVACASPLSGDADRAAYSAALATLARDPEAGAEALRAFVDQRPKSPLADDAALRLAEARVDAGDDDEAVRRLGWLLRHHPEGDRSDAARMLLARLQRARGDPASAYRTAQGIRLALLEGPQRAAAHRLLADLAAEAGDVPGHLRWLARVRSDQEKPEDVARVDAELESALVALSPEELERAARDLGRVVPAARVLLRQADLALGRGDAEQAARLLERASRLPLAPPDATRLTAFEDRLHGGVGPAGGVTAFPDGARIRGTLGVVLPLSGEIAGAGEETLDGILLASGVLDPAAAPADGGPPPASAPGLRLRVRDSGGVPERAAAAVRELGEDPAVLAVLGPLTAEEAKAAAPEADRLTLPMITLTRYEEVAAGHPDVFRIGLTPDAEARTLAAYAAGPLGLRRVGILYPEDGYGERMRGLFAAAFEAQGGSVVASASYAVDSTDFSAPIGQLIRNAGARPLDPERDSAPGAPPEVPGGFDGIFVPDAHRAAALIAPALAFAGIRGVRLLGTSGWNDPALVAVGRDHVEGAVFPGAVVRDSRSPMLAEFASRFQEGFGRPPDALAALGFDAALLALRGLVGGSASREALRASLIGSGPLQGVSGTTEFVNDGNAQRRPYLLGVEGGRIVDLDDLGRPPLLPGAAPQGPSPALAPTR
jgi:branched-chain amino acid transport system substrate-binding protein